ncbi:MAG: 4-hydroxy-tetrahydrodipicolinate reductase, partial [Planctomycetota bacterium]
MIRLAIHGAAGRMGARLCALAREDSRFEVVAEIDLPTPSRTDVDVDAIVDFSSDDGARNAAELARKHAAALLVGTTGLSSQTLQSLDVAARSTPVLVASNTSVGIAVLGDVAARVARLLGPGYDLSLLEHHHVHKRDAPSGTALRLAKILRGVEGVKLEPDQIHA